MIGEGEVNFIRYLLYLDFRVRQSLVVFKGSRKIDNWHIDNFCIRSYFRAYCDNSKFEESSTMMIFPQIE